jgi:predicted dithiol-disulfide oxidoreductase (DUF899 family)
MTKNDSGYITDHPVLPHEQWVAARTALLAQEKEFTRLRDELTKWRRALPWERVEKDYAFDTPDGRQPMGDLFEHRRQLVMYHFMFAPEWSEGCKHCSFWADSFNSLGVHLNHRNTTFVAVSRAPLEKLEAFKRRMGWNFRWVSSAPSDFNFDYNVSFLPERQQGARELYNYQTEESGPEREGASAFYRDAGGAIFHTYSTYARGIDLLNVTYNFLDLTAMGRDEVVPQSWVRHHDRY